MCFGESVYALKLVFPSKNMCSHVVGKMWDGLALLLCSFPFHQPPSHHISRYMKAFALFCICLRSFNSVFWCTVVRRPKCCPIYNCVSYSSNSRFHTHESLEFSIHKIHKWISSWGSRSPGWVARLFLGIKQCSKSIRNSMFYVGGNMVVRRFKSQFCRAFLCVHVLLVSSWVFSSFSGFLPQCKTCRSRLH